MRYRYILNNKSGSLVRFCVLVIFAILTTSCSGLPNETKTAIISHVQSEAASTSFWFCIGDSSSCPPKLCERGCDEIEITRAKAIEVSRAEQANGIQKIWCVDVELIAIDKNGLWEDEKLSYRVTHHDSGLVELDDRSYSC